jgi:hypothetical protein
MRRRVAHSVFGGWPRCLLRRLDTPSTKSPFTRLFKITLPSDILAALEQPFARQCQAHGGFNMAFFKTTTAPVS